MTPEEGTGRINAAEAGKAVSSLSHEPIPKTGLAYVRANVRSEQGLRFVLWPLVGSSTKSENGASVHRGPRACHGPKWQT